MKKRRGRHELVVAPTAGAGTLAELRPDLADEADAFAEASLAANSRRAIKADWEIFSSWCAAQGFVAMPATADAVAGFFTDQARTKKVATLTRYRATIGKLHRLRGLPSPCADARVQAVLAGIRRTKGVAQDRKQPMTIGLAERAASSRDRAIVLFGLSTSFRGAELCRLDISDLTWTDKGIIVHLRRSKTDQAGEGRSVGVPRLDDAPATCPVRALRAWLDDLRREEGPLFRVILRDGQIADRRLTEGAVNKVVKGVAAAAGLDPAKFGAHSLRAGYVTEARKAGQDWVSIMAQTGHKRLETVQRYDRGAIDPFRASKVADIFTAAFDGDSRYFKSSEAWEALGTACRDGGVTIKRIGLPPPSRDQRILSQFSGTGGEHESLCSSVARWFEQNSIPWSAAASYCRMTAGLADVAAKDGSVVAEVGQTRVDKVVAFLRDGQSVLLAPYHFGGVVGFLLSGTVKESESEKAVHAALMRAFETFQTK